MASANYTPPIAAAGTLTGTTLAANVVASSLTSVGTLTSLTTSGNITGQGANLTATMQNQTNTGVQYLGGGTAVNVNAGASFTATAPA
jgi:hypothetical protein